MKHITQLDGMRAIAVLMVVISHAGFGNLVPGGFGVTIFFFLSGYLITSLMRAEMAETGRLDFAGFYLRRTLRIMPPLYLTMLLTYLATRLLMPDYGFQAGGLIAQALFVSNYSTELGADGGVYIPLWSLAVEEHFYLIAPWIFAALLARFPARAIARWCAIGCALVLAVRIGSAFTVSDLGRIYFWSHTRIDSILFGCCLALWNNPVLDRDAWRPRPIHILGAAAVIVLCIGVRDEYFRQTLRYSLQGGALLVMFSWVLGNQGAVKKALSSYPMRIVGLYSYTIYLSHEFFIWVLRAYVPGLPRIGVLACGLTLATAYAAAMYTLVEAPAARLRRTLRQSSKEATVVGVESEVPAPADAPVEGAASTG